MSVDCGCVLGSGDAVFLEPNGDMLPMVALHQPCLLRCPLVASQQSRVSRTACRVWYLHHRHHPLTWSSLAGHGRRSRASRGASRKRGRRDGRSMGIDMAADVEEGAAVASIAGRRLIASFGLSVLVAILGETSSFALVCPIRPSHLSLSHCDH
jgi:hypothetical protein